MKTCCPKCNSTNVAIEETDGDSFCRDCGYEDKSSKFPKGEYKIAVPDLQGIIDKWCEEASVSKEGYFYKNASKMCAEIIDTYTKPWEDENKALKLLINSLEMKMGYDFVSQALSYINNGNDTFLNIVEEDGKEVEKGTLILSYQHTPEDDDEI